MNNYIILKEELQSFSDEELSQYIYKNVDSLTILTFNALKKEIINRKDLPNEVKMLIGNIQDLRNKNFINEIFPYLYSKNKEIKTVEDLIADLKKNEISEPDITSLLYQLPQIIEINAQSNYDNSIKTLWLLSCIAIAIISFQFFTPSSALFIILLSMLSALYIVFNRNDHSRIVKLKTNIESHLNIIE